MRQEEGMELRRYGRKKDKHEVRQGERKAVMKEVEEVCQERQEDREKGRREDRKKGRGIKDRQEERR